jgi:type IV pilus assembly protein PilW
MWNRQSGLSLIELLVAMGLGLILVVGIGTVYLGSRQTYRMQEANARVQETGRFALEVIGRSMRLAGADANITANVTAVTVQCDDGTGTCTAIAGTNGAAGAPDTMTVQFYAGMDESSGGNWGARDCTGGFTNASTLITNAFSLNANDLRCTGSVGGVAPLVSEIEDLQAIYGIDTDANQSADIYTAAPTAAQLPNVVTAKVCVMVRSTDQGLAASGQRPLDCARALGTATGAAPAIADTRLHRAFVATYNLRNRITNTP